MLVYLYYISMSQAMSTELTTLCPLLANPDFRHHPYAQPLNATFADIDLLLFALQIASAMDHLAQRNVSCHWHWHQCTSRFGNSFGKAQLICTLYKLIQLNLLLDTAKAANYNHVKECHSRTVVSIPLKVAECWMKVYGFAFCISQFLVV